MSIHCKVGDYYRRITCFETEEDEWLLSYEELNGKKQRVYEPWWSGFVLYIQHTDPAIYMALNRFLKHGEMHMFTELNGSLLKIRTLAPLDENMVAIDIFEDGGKIITIFKHAYEPIILWLAN